MSAIRGLAMAEELSNDPKRMLVHCRIIWAALVMGLLLVGGVFIYLIQSGGTADAAGDHRLAMAFAIAALGAGAPCRITGAGAVDVSYPGFFDVLESICE